MKYLYRILSQFALIAVLTLPFQSSLALERFEKSGVIQATGSDSITIRDNQYLITSTTKHEKVGNQKSGSAKLNKGDRVAVQGYILDGKNYVEAYINMGKTSLVNH